jgi:two-component system, chemotaxis family, sensor kinase CheA
MDPSFANQFVGQFLLEAEELLAKIESAALSMGGSETSLETLNEVFRAFHTLKGNSSMCGFTDVADFTHHIETMLDKAREGEIPVTDQFSNLMLGASDHIRALLAAAQGDGNVEAGAGEALLGEVRDLSGQPRTAVRPRVPAPAPLTTVWSIVFRPGATLFAQGGEPILILDELKQLGECVIEAHTDLVPKLEELDPDVCHFWWTIRLTGPVNRAAIQDVFLFVAGQGELTIEPVAEEAVPPVEPVKAEARAPAARPQAQPPEATIRVPSAKLDRLVNLVGELVMNQSRLATAATRCNTPELAAPVEEIERLVAALRDDVLQIRMMPIGSIFSRFKRLVHDLSRELGKEINLVTEGEDTELDKSVLDQLAEPLVHLVRNSADHGVETAAERLAKGKPAQGTIRLAAAHRGSDVVVTIEDDGAGMNRDRIRAKAVSKQLLAPDANLSDKDILNLILLPGFSTAATVTSVSGRGVGMDVVKRQIDSLHGSLSLASEQGKGCCVSLTLPLTLAIIDGLLVEAGESQYIIPMAVVTENVELPQKDRGRYNGRNLVAVRGELIPYIDLREAFRMEGSGPAISKIVLVRHENQRIGLVVDRVMGTHQTVIQALGGFFRHIEVVSGSTVMGDGRVALILEVPGVVRLAGRQCQPNVSELTAA